MSQSKHIGVCKTKCLANNSKKKKNAGQRGGVTPWTDEGWGRPDKKEKLYLLTKIFKKYEKL